MTDREALGEFEHHVLLATLRLGKRAYTASIVLELEERTGRDIAPAAVYIALRRLESKGLVKSALRVGGASGDRRQRRYFRVTDPGMRAMHDSRQRFERLWEGLAPFVEDR